MYILKGVRQAFYAFSRKLLINRLWTCIVRWCIFSELLTNVDPKWKAIYQFVYLLRTKNEAL